MMTVKWQILFPVILGLALLGLADSDKAKISNRINSGPHCLRHCNDMFFEDMYSMLGEDVMSQLKTLSLDKILHTFANTTNFKLFCKIYGSHKVCMNDCPASFFREIFRQGMRIIDFHCVDRYKDIVKYFPCFGRIKTNETCLNSCATNRAALYQLSSQFKNLALAGDSHQAERLLNESCEFMSCTLDCDIPRIRHTCGEPLVNLLHELVINSFDIIHDIALGTGAIEIWPTRCTLLQNYTVPPPPKKSQGQSATPEVTIDESAAGRVESGVDSNSVLSNDTPKKSAKESSSSDSHTVTVTWNLVLFSALLFFR